MGGISLVVLGSIFLGWVLLYLISAFLLVKRFELPKALNLVAIVLVPFVPLTPVYLIILVVIGVLSKRPVNAHSE